MIKIMSIVHKLLHHVLNLQALPYDFKLCLRFDKKNMKNELSASRSIF